MAVMTYEQYLDALWEKRSNVLEPLYTRVHTPYVIRGDVSRETYQHVMREAYTYLHNVSELLFTAINMYIMLQNDDPLNTAFTTEKNIASGKMRNVQQAIQLGESLLPGAFAAIPVSTEISTRILGASFNETTIQLVDFIVTALRQIPVPRGGCRRLSRKKRARRQNRRKTRRV